MIAPLTTAPKRRRAKLIDLACETCGKSFTAHRKSAKFCSEQCKINARPKNAERKEVLQKQGFRCTYTFPDGRVCARSYDRMYVIELWNHVRGFDRLKRVLRGSPLGRIVHTKVPLCIEHRGAIKRIKHWARHPDGTFDLALEAQMPGPPELYCGTVRKRIVHVSIERTLQDPEIGPALDEALVDALDRDGDVPWDCRDPLDILIEREERAESLIAEFTHSNREVVLQTTSHY